MKEFIGIFINVVLPVFGIVVIGYLFGGRLQLQARTLTRVAYYVFVPAFIFQAISSSQVPLDNTLKMFSFIVVAQLLSAVVGGGIGWLLWGRRKEMIAALAMIAAYGNVGNYGLAVIGFSSGDQAIAPATIYLIAITITGFIVCVGSAGWARGGSKGAIFGVLKTPALWATVPALFVSAGDFVMPLMITRMISLLADAMIPVMLFALGLQLLEQHRIIFSGELVVATGVKLLLAPTIAYALSGAFKLNSIEINAGVLQAGMPTAILVAIIAKENNIIPDFVASVVVVSTLASLLTLTLWMMFLGG